MSKSNKRNKYSNINAQKPIEKPESIKSQSVKTPLSIFKGFSAVFIPLLLFITFILFRYAFDKKLMLVGDDTDYYSLGKALFQGDGYVSILSPSKSPNNHFPPGYPFYLSLVMHISETILFLKKSGLFLLFVTVFCLFKFFNKLVENKLLCFVAVLFVVANPVVLKYSNALMSEMLFLTLAAMVFYFFAYINEQKAFYRQPYFYLALLSIAAAYYTRAIGLALLGGVVLSLLFQKKWLQSLSFIIGFVALVLPWQLRSNSLGGSSYLRSIAMINPYRPELGTLTKSSDWIDRIVLNFKRYYALEIPTLVQTKLPAVNYDQVTTEYWVLGTIILGLFAYGLVVLKNYRWLLFGVFGATMFIMLIYPEVWVGTRFIVHLIPVFVFVIIYGVYDLFMRFLPNQKALWGVLIPIVFGLGLFSFKPDLKLMNFTGKIEAYSPPMENFIATSRWIAANTSDSAVVINRKPSIFYLYSGKYSLQFPNTDDKKVMLDFFDTNNVSHVIVDGLGYAATGRYLVPVINAEPEKFKKVYELSNPSTYVFEYIKNVGYKGETLNGKRHGKGEYKYANGSFYNGNWQNDQMAGQGTLILADKKKYIGSFANDQFNGTGVYYDAKGKVLFQGQWKNGQPAR